VHLLRAELSWSQYGVLMRVADARARTFYEGLSIRNGWSVRELEEQVRTDLYGRSLREGNAPPAIAAPAAATRPEEAFRARLPVRGAGASRRLRRSGSGASAARQLRAPGGRTRAGLLRCVAGSNP